ncbi:hypothetical protein GX563_06790 [Candidatus Bathyarchaeota archaeon]|nr:hypothetical protein [Candidatus Bathyarchaeota archaeon]
MLNKKPLFLHKVIEDEVAAPTPLLLISKKTPNPQSNIAQNIAKSPFTNSMDKNMPFATAARSYGAAFPKPKITPWQKYSDLRLMLRVINH